MAGLFDTFTTANRGLTVMQNAINTSSHNIANVATNGYSRQRVQIETTTPFGGNNRFAMLRAGQVGTGAEVTAIQRIRDTFIDYRVREASTDVGTATITNQYYTKIENILGEISTKGIQGALSSMYADFQELVGATDTPANRKEALASAESLTNLLNSRYNKLQDLTDDAQTELKNTVNSINTKLNDIRNLNQEILKISSLGMSANDLMDKRDLLVDQLSSEFGIDVDRESFDRIVVGATETDDTLVAKDFNDSTYTRFSYVDSAEYAKDQNGNSILKITYMKLGSPEESAKEELTVTGTEDELKELKEKLETNRVLTADYEGYIGRTRTEGNPTKVDTNTGDVELTDGLGNNIKFKTVNGSIDLTTITGIPTTANISQNDDGSICVKYVDGSTTNLTASGYETYKNNSTLSTSDVSKSIFKVTEGEIAGYQQIQSEIDNYIKQLNTIAASIAYTFNAIQTGDATGSDMNNLIFVTTDSSVSEQVQYTPSTTTPPDLPNDKYTFGSKQYLYDNASGNYKAADGETLEKFRSGSNDIVFELTDNNGKKTQYKLNSDGDKAYLITDTGINAGNISVNGVLYNDTTKLNCGDTSVSGEGDGNRALAMAKIANLKIMYTKLQDSDLADRASFLSGNAGISFDEDGIGLTGNTAGSTISGKYNTEITNLGTKLESSKTALDSAEYTQSVALNDRDQVSGVSLDEEMTDIVKFNHAYQANAKVISTVSSLLDVVIGLV